MNLGLPDLLRHAIQIHQRGGRVVACLVFRARGSTPQTAGAIMLVDDAANTWGTIGGGCVEAEVRQNAFRMLADDRTGCLRFKLDHDYGWDDGLICGGTLDVVVGELPGIVDLQRIVEAIERREAVQLPVRFESEDGPAQYTLEIPPRDRLLIAGAGHIGQALARLALDLDFDVAVYDDRGDLMERLLPDGVERITGDIATNLRETPVDAGTWCVIVTRGHRHDEAALEAVADRGARYVGMIGSRRKVKLIVDDLTERGVRPEALSDVHAPIGLDIGAVSVTEIAVSIAGQLVQHRGQHGRVHVNGPIMLPVAVDAQPERRAGA